MIWFDFKNALKRSVNYQWILHISVSPLYHFALQCTPIFFFVVVIAVILRFEMLTCGIVIHGKHIWENIHRKYVIFPWINIRHILSGFFEKLFLKLSYPKIICPQFNRVRFKHIPGQFKKSKTQVLMWASDISERKSFQWRPGITCLECWPCWAGAEVLLPGLSLPFAACVTFSGPQVTHLQWHHPQCQDF